MSIRAHRIEEIKHAGESFNLWHDEEIVDYLDNEGLLDQLNEDMSGFIEINREDLKNMLAITKDENARISLQDDMRWAEENEQDTILYYCF